MMQNNNTAYVMHMVLQAGYVWLLEVFELDSQFWHSCVAFQYIFCLGLH